MILGTKKTFLRHTLTGALSLILFFLLWFLKSGSVGSEVALWRALGDVGFILLFLTLVLGPLAMLWKPALTMVPWRREFGIWFAVLGFLHMVIISIRMFNFDIALMYSGAFGFANLLGSIGLFLGLILAATSSDRAVKYLGIGSWKWLHTMAYVIFYLVAFHMVYHLFFKPSTPNVLSYVFLGMAIAIPVLQAASFVRIVVAQRQRLNIKKNNKNLVSKVKSVKKVAERTYQIDFDIHGKEFPFEAGQHTGIWLPKLRYKDYKGRFRIFSIASSPNNKETLSVTMRDTGSGFKRTLFALKKGAEAELMGATGYFVLPKNKSQEVVFIAGGIGITPFKSMINYAAEEKLKNKITLHYINRNKETATYISEIKKLEKKNKNFSMEAYFDEQEFKSSVRKSKNSKDCLWYVAGPPSMVNEIKNILFQKKIHPSQIITEEFVGY